MDLAEPLPSFVPDSALFFSLPVDSVSDPVPFPGMIFAIKLTTVGFCCLQPKLSLTQFEWGIWAGWKTRKQVGCSEVSGTSGEAVWRQKPTEPKASKAVFLDGHCASDLAEDWEFTCTGRTHLCLRLGCLRLVPNAPSHDLLLC